MAWLPRVEPGMSRPLGKNRVSLSSEGSRARRRSDIVEARRGRRRRVRERGTGNWLDLGKLRSREGLRPTWGPKVEGCRQGGSDAERPAPKQLGLGSSQGEVTLMRPRNSKTLGICAIGISDQIWRRGHGWTRKWGACVRVCKLAHLKSLVRLSDSVRLR